MILHEAEALRADKARVLVVGSGPAGLVVALELRRHGLDVAVIESGGEHVDVVPASRPDADIVDPRRHAPLDLAVCRALGGTSRLWGGRCVAFDEIDFAPRPAPAAPGWPLRADDPASWYGIALRYLDAGEPVFSAPVAGLRCLADCRIDQLERWSNSRNLSELHKATLTHDQRLRIYLGATLTGLDIDPHTGEVNRIEVVMRSGAMVSVRKQIVVLACGGLETTRVLLIAQTQRPMLFAGCDGPLGRYYMGHLSGQIADIVIENAELDVAMNFFLDGNGRYVRRRFAVTGETQRRENLLNFAAYPDNPRLDDPRHRSAILSLAYLALAFRPIGSRLAPEAIRRIYLRHGVKRVPRHMLNVLAGLPMACFQASDFLFRRYLAKARVPGFFIRNRSRRYAFHYCAEQAPSEASRVRLGARRDDLGLPRLVVDLRYSEQDAASVVRSHAVLDRSLRDAGLARIEYGFREQERVSVVLDQASDGYHQLGSTRMSADARHGVVDRNCRVHGTTNLFVASSSVFPTSGHANPTLLVAALAARLAAHLRDEYL